jgi:DNA polymerase-1
VLDIETDGLRPTKIHVCVTKDIDTGITREWYYADDLRSHLRNVSLLVAHNGISFDLPALARLWDIHFDPKVVFDTLVASQLLDFTREGGHSLEAWGNTLGHPKVGADITDWSKLTHLMVARCKADVEINHMLYAFLWEQLKTKHKDKFADAFALESDIARICYGMHRDGFGFDIGSAHALYNELDKRIGEIDVELTKAFPPKVKTTVLKTKIKEELIPFNPSSPKQIVERLEPFWKPKDKTEKGQPKINETNLATLKEDAPDACKELVERLLLVGRLRALKQWIDAYDETTGRVHAEFRGIGTWTGRMGHRNPNLANIAAPKSIKYKAEDLASLATTLGSRMRRLWKASEGDSWLVGTDAEGIQLRIFGHYINDQKFIEALISGNKDEGTDPHSLNSAILECDRDTAKTFIYAFLLGAGDKKIGEILGVSARRGADRKKAFIEAYPGLAKLKGEQIPKDAARGFFESFDGREVKCNSEHLMMAGYLQTGEACIMKWANVEWRRRLSNEVAFRWRQVNFVHDEWQTEVQGTREQAEYVGRVQAEAIRAAGEAFALNCPMAGAFRVGQNWMDTH